MWDDHPDSRPNIFPLVRVDRVGILFVQQMVEMMEYRVRRHDQLLLLECEEDGYG
jgi:hypothetical protein